MTTVDSGISDSTGSLMAPPTAADLATRLGDVARPCAGCAAGVWLRLGGVWMHHTAENGSLQHQAATAVCGIASEVRRWQ